MRITWYAIDGYAGPSRPQYFEFPVDEVDEEYGDSDIREWIEELLQEAFEQSVCAELARDIDDLVAEIREEVRNRKA